MAMISSMDSDSTPSVGLSAIGFWLPQIPLLQRRDSTWLRCLTMALSWLL
jgi:hypothetical protein